MDKDERLGILENALAQMLRPVRGIPFNVVVKSLSKKNIVRIDLGTKEDSELLEKIKLAVTSCTKDLLKNPIERSRPNEVGNDIENYIMRALMEVGLLASRPTSLSGKTKITGYPDILIEDAYGRPTYIECKMFGYGKDFTTMRSFYLSPSEAFKVSCDARHLLLAYGMTSKAIISSNKSRYFPKSFKLIDLHDLLCDVKYEFNSDNRRLYSKNLLLLEGEFGLEGSIVKREILVPDSSDEA